MAAGMVAEVPREHAAKVKEMGMDIEYRPAEDFPAESAQAEARAEAGERGAGEEGSEEAGKDAGEGGKEEGSDEGGEAEEGEETEKPVIVLRTPPYDPRFPSTNQVGGLDHILPGSRVFWHGGVNPKLTAAATDECEGQLDGVAARRHATATRATTSTTAAWRRRATTRTSAACLRARTARCAPRTGSSAGTRRARRGVGRAGTRRGLGRVCWVER